MDPRLTLFNGRVAHVSLRGKVAAQRFTKAEPMRVIVPVADLCPQPGADRARQLLLGQGFDVLDSDGGGWCFGSAARDGHAGWIATAALAPWRAATHRVAAAAHLYPAPQVKAVAGPMLSPGAEVTVTARDGAWVQTDGGAWLVARALRALDDPAPDPVAVALALLGTPYLWGGDSRDGIDCSGLVQAACHACALPCPPDSDLQAAGLGRPLAGHEALRRGDAVFWRGHVGLMVDALQMVHANAHHMAVAVEPLDGATARIAAAGGGAIIQRRRFLP